MYRQQKNDAMIQTRVKSTTLYTVARFFAQKGLTLQNKSLVVRQALEEFETVLIKNGLAERVTDIIEAREGLAELGLGDLNTGGRGGRNFMEEQQRAVYEHEGWDSAEIGMTRTKRSVEAELKGIVEDPTQLAEVITNAQRIATDKQAARSKSEHDELGDVSSVPVVEKSNE